MKEMSMKEDAAKLSDVGASFELVKDAIGIIGI